MSSLMVDQGGRNGWKYPAFMIYPLIEVPKHQALTQRQHHQLLSLQEKTAKSLCSARSPNVSWIAPP